MTWIKEQFDDSQILRTGHTRKVTIPECVEFTITTNACRGYCESFAVPSAWYRLQNNPSQSITSVGTSAVEQFTSPFCAKHEMTLTRFSYSNHSPMLQHHGHRRRPRQRNVCGWASGACV